MTTEGERQLAAQEEEKEQKKRKLTEENVIRGSGKGGQSLVSEEQEAAVGRCFFGIFPSLVVGLKHAEARAAQRQAAAVLG